MNKVFCQVQLLNCKGEAETIMDYRVSPIAVDEFDVYTLEDGEETIYRTAISVCRNCGIQFEKTLNPKARDSLIIKKLCQKNI